MCTSFYEIESAPVTHKLVFTWSRDVNCVANVHDLHYRLRNELISSLLEQQLAGAARGVQSSGDGQGNCVVVCPPAKLYSNIEEYFSTTCRCHTRAPFANLSSPKFSEPRPYRENREIFWRLQAADYCYGKKYYFIWLVGQDTFSAFSYIRNTYMGLSIDVTRTVFTKAMFAWPP